MGYQEKNIQVIVNFNGFIFYLVQEYFDKDSFKEINYAGWDTDGG